MPADAIATDTVLIDEVCSAWNVAKDNTKPLRIRLAKFDVAKRLFHAADEHNQPELMRRCGINPTKIDHIGRILQDDARRVRNMLIMGIVVGLLMLAAILL